MALVRCPDCTMLVSNQAPACISCGCPISPELVPITTAAPEALRPPPPTSNENVCEPQAQEEEPSKELGMKWCNFSIFFLYPASAMVQVAALMFGAKSADQSRNLAAVGIFGTGAIYAMATAAGLSYRKAWGWWLNCISTIAGLFCYIWLIKIVIDQPTSALGILSYILSGFLVFVPLGIYWIKRKTRFS